MINIKMPEEGERSFFMLANFFVSRRKSEETGYTNTSFRLQGVGLNGTIPVRVCYFGKQVMGPVMEKVLDASTGKAKLDKDGKELLVEKKDKDGNVVLAPKTDKDGKDVLRDDNYADRVDLLSMFSGNLEDNHFTDAIRVIAKTRTVVGANGEKYAYFAVCGNEEVPIEVVDFSTDAKPDYRYRSNCVKLSSIAERV